MRLARVRRIEAGVDSAAIMGASSDSEVLAQELDHLGSRIMTLETRLAEVEAIIKGLEMAAATTARGLEEVATHWEAVYRAMRRAE